MPSKYTLTKSDRQELAVAAVQASALRLSGGSVSNWDARKIAESYYDFLVKVVEDEH